MFLKNYNRMNLRKDIPAGIIIALVSIPISMGYSQIAGLPAIYGLYGSVLPILLFGLCSSSPQFVFGVDAAPAALVGECSPPSESPVEPRKPWPSCRWSP